MLFIYLVVLVLLIENSFGDSVNNIVETINGRIQGAKLRSRNGREYFAFRGIRYGHSERFELATPVEPWDGIYNASEFGADCFQFEPLYKQTFIGEEDCLFLNIYTPVLTTLSNQSLPVMVWLHGGGFAFGSGNLYSAKYFMDQDVILVTLNYRLSAFGFLDSQDGVMPGNLGLKDQKLALQWIKLNINRFSGDSNKVTLFGSSAGGASVGIHLLTDAKDLFHRAISQSSDALSAYVIQRRPKENFLELANILNCSTNTGSLKIKNCLKDKTAEEVIIAVSQFKVGNPISKVYFVFTPSVENSSLETLLDTCPINLLQEGNNLKDIPWINGFCEHDGLFNIGPLLENPELIDHIYSNWTSIAPWLLLYKYDATEAEQLKISEYLREKFLTKNNQINRDNFYKILSEMVQDRWGFFEGMKSMNLWRKHANIYPYIFAYPGNFSFVNHFWKLKHRHGIGHLDELQYLFNEIYGAPEYSNDTEAGKFSEYFIKLWVSFAKHGTSSEQNWNSPAPGELLQFFKINDNQKKEFAEIEDQLKDRMQIWTQINLQTCHSSIPSAGLNHPEL